MPALAPTAPGNLARNRPRWEIADILHEHGEAYRRNNPLPPSHLKVMRAIEVCRTAALGGHVERCTLCAFERQAYNSCRNRHCPKCQAMAKAKWLEARRSELLPVGYFHNVFTLPHELNPLALCNKKVVFNLLFQCVSETLQDFAADPKHGLGGKIGFTAVLHTWDQTLKEHIHLHCVIPAGVLADDGSRWVHARANYLFPVKAMSRLFRGKFIDLLKRAFHNGELIFPGQTTALGTQAGFSLLICQLWKKEWVVYSKAPFGSPQKVLDYLGRYVHRVAISNHRITNVENGNVSFAYRDRRDGDKLKEMTLPAEVFIGRFLLHVLPNSYMRIRHFGLLANRFKRRQLGRCRQLLDLPKELPILPKKTMQERMLQLTGIDVTQCPCCKLGRMVTILELHPVPIRAVKAPNGQPTKVVVDSS